jgi:hypothetical protein
MAKDPRARVIRTSKTQKAGIFLQDNAVSIVGDSRHFIVVDERGITIKGPVSFISDSMGRRTAGLFTGINDFLEMIPQSIVTPIPSKIPYPPVFAVADIVRDLAFFSALLV